MKITNEIRQTLNEKVISTHYYILVKEGQGLINLNACQYFLSENLTIILNPLDLFNIPQDTNITGTIIQFSNKELINAKRDIINKGSGVYKNTNYTYLSHIIDTYFSESENLDLSPELRTSAAITRIQIELNKNKVITIYPYCTSDIIGATRKFILDNMEYITNCADLCTQLNFKFTKLNLQFQHWYETSIKDILLSLKCISVNELALNGLEYTEAVSNVKFGSYITFLKWYKKIFGCKPSKYKFDSIKIICQGSPISNMIAKYL